MHVSDDQQLWPSRSAQHAHPSLGLAQDPDMVLRADPQSPGAHTTQNAV